MARRAPGLRPTPLLLRPTRGGHRPPACRLGSGTNMQRERRRWSPLVFPLLLRGPWGPFPAAFPAPASH
eukprot:1859830-Lingulodinium_polyedra.AAC.1